jgi:hypothetical protein
MNRPARLAPAAVGASSGRRVGLRVRRETTAHREASMIVRSGFVAAAVVMYAVGASAQDPATETGPATRIFVAPFNEGHKRTTRIALLVIQSQGVDVGKPVKLPNHFGDDSQPLFLPDSSGLVVWSSRAGRPIERYRYDLATKTVTRLSAEIEPLTAGNGDGVGRTPAGSMVMGRKSRLLIWQDGEDHWIGIADFRKAKVSDITRVVVSPDGRWIAVVAKLAAK